MTDALIEQLIAARGGRGGVTPPSATQPLATSDAYATQDRLRAALVARFALPFGGTALLPAILARPARVVSIASPILSPPHALRLREGRGGAQ